MKVLVTGASGFVGSHMVDTLLKAGHSVRGLSRKAPTADRRKAEAEYIDGVDVTVSTSFTPQMFEDVDALVHLVGIIQEGPGGQTFQRIHVDGTQNLVDAAKDGGFYGRFVYMSAIGSAPDAPAEYSRTKYAAEQVVTRGGFAYTILRPSLVMGWDGEFVAQMGDLIKHGGLPVPLPFPFIPVPGPGENKFQPIDVGRFMRLRRPRIDLPGDRQPTLRGRRRDTGDVQSAPGGLRPAPRRQEADAARAHRRPQHCRHRHGGADVQAPCHPRSTP